MPAPAPDDAAPPAPAWLRLPEDADALEPSLWSDGAVRGEDGAIRIAGVDVRELAERYGTPLLVIDEVCVRGRAAGILRTAREAFAEHGGRVRVYYAGKAMLTTHVVRWMLAAGLHVDVCSEGELRIALAAGADPARIGMHGNNKSDAELELAIGTGVGAIVADSLQELERIDRIASGLGRLQAVRIRSNPGVHASTHGFLATAHEDQKFGIPLEQLPEAAGIARASSGMRLLGLHAHIGSQIFAADGFLAAAERLLAAHLRLLEDGPLPELNLGGGFGIPQVEGERPADVAGIMRRLAGFLAGRCAELGVPLPLVAFEPGRSIIGPAGTTLYRIGTSKEVPVTVEDGRTAVRRYLSVDGGMSDNLRPALYGADATARLADRRGAAPPRLSRVAGKHCEAGDVVVRDCYLPGDAEPGDLLAVPATGAYCAPMSSNYNAVPRPAIVAVREGEHRVLVRRERIADLLARDTGAAGPTGPRSRQEPA